MTTTTDAPDGAPTIPVVVDAAPVPQAPIAPVAAPAPAGVSAQPIRDEAALREFQARHAATKKELDTLKARGKAEANATHWAEHEELQAFKAARLVADAEAERDSIRKGNADAILQGVNPDMRDDVALMLSGMQQAKTIDMYDKTDGAAARLRAQLQADRPGWFSDAVDAGPGGILGSPGLTIEGGGPGLSGEHANEQVLGMTDEAFKASYVKPRNQGGAKL